MRYFDFHCDTLMRLYELRNNGNTLENIYQNKGHVDLERLIKSNYSAQCFASFLDLGSKPYKESLYDDALAMIDMFYDEISKYSDKIAVATTYDEYMKNKKEGKVSGILTIEEGGILDGKIERLEELHKKGIKMITLTWNYENCIGFPNYKYVHKNEGLKPFGIEVVEKMDELGIVSDVSHLSDGGFWDVYKYSKKPFIATHSNAREMRDHSRNLTDEMIRKMAERGGLIGLNFAGYFLGEDDVSRLDDMAKHIKHIVNVGGLDIMSLGSDFDGIGGDLEVAECSQMDKIVTKLEKEGFKEREIEAICFENGEKFLERFDRA